ncbi:alkaline ceramidase 1 [Dasypus novemcinctus]|uniref:alkaline ceramidase 1 n=1 Tax=Dasypus novemcinctus TaxID=9361 RepID=UPI00265EA22D|nr:alkaline ceramidase 1 [Dasypus novemcinctus]
MPSIFAYQSSEVDWCESNFQYSELVAEFYNTVSNVFFLILGPLTMYLMHPYAQKHSCPVYLVCALLTVIGLFSMYFHMTLSFVGQLLDELSILWLLATFYGLWLPRCYFPAFLGKSRSHFKRLVFLITVVSTLLAVVRPTFNSYVLNLFGVYVVSIVIREYRKIGKKEVRRLIEITLALWALALTSWLSDRLLCDFWQRIHFFYLHSIWHVLISFSCPYGLTALLMVDASYEKLGKALRVRYWPRDTWPVGLPYLEAREDDRTC